MLDRYELNNLSPSKEGAAFFNSNNICIVPSKWIVKLLHPPFLICLSWFHCLPMYFWIPVFVVWGPIAERFLGSIRYFQPPARGRAGATKKEDRTATQKSKKNYGSCPKKNGRQIPVKQQCTDSCWDWRAVGRSLVWPRWIPCRKERLSIFSDFYQIPLTPESLPLE